MDVRVSHPVLTFLALLLSLQTRELSCCLENERQSLLQFKRGIVDPTKRLSSWAGKDCCSWRGVGCNDSTGHVLQLDLRNTAADSESSSLQGEIRPSLLGLEHLTYLDLSNNDFDAISIPTFLGSFHRLRYLNLSLLSLEGTIPHQLGNLSSLHHLDLSSNSLLVLDNAQWISRLTALQHLDLSSIIFQEGTDWLQALNELPSIVEVRLSQSTIPDIPLSLPHVNFTSLSTLDLSYNYLNSTLPGWFLNLTSLEHLHLEGNYFGIRFPDAIKNMIFLKELDLSYNHFVHGDGSQTMEHHCQLESLSLSWMNITGDLTPFERTLSGCVSNSLMTLDLGGNQLNGSLPEWIGEFRKLESLFFYSNSLYGPIPASLGRLSALQTLMLAGNGLNGTVPESLGGLSSLAYLDLGSNSLEGVLSEGHFANLTRLRYLDISSNSLAIELRSGWISPFQLETIRMRSCRLGPRFPGWLRTQVKYSWLDLSYTGISDSVPHWFWNLPSKIENIDLSHNDLKGEVPDLRLGSRAASLSIDLSSNSFEGHVPLFSSSTVKVVLDLSNNSLSGPIPASIGRVMPQLRYLSLSVNNIQGSVPSSMCKMKNLIVLDLSRNRLSGELPNCWQNVRGLLVFDLSKNNLTGVLPTTVCSIAALVSLHLDNNNMHGKLPVSMRSLRGLLTLDLGSNKFTGKIPYWLGDSLSGLLILRLRSNMFHGQIPPQLSHLSALQILDLSHNDISGTIPPSFSNFSAMKVSHNRTTSLIASYKENLVLVVKSREAVYDKLLSLVTTLDLSENNLWGQIPEDLMALHGLWSLNLSGNHLSGEITYKFGQLQHLESLDLSRNQLSGSIPPTLSNLSFLSHLNLSYNNLTGRIPSGNQLNTFIDPSAFIGNQDLCGFPLDKACDSVVTNEPSTDNGGADIEGYESSNDIIWLYVSMGPGFVIGFWIVWGILLFKNGWRHAYFRFVDNMFDIVYVAAILNFRLIKRKLLKRDQDVA